MIIKGIIYKIVKNESTERIPFHEIKIISAIATVILVLLFVIVAMVYILN